MIKIIEKEAKIKEYDVEPKVATLYYTDEYCKNAIKFENCMFKKATPVVWGASDANEYRLEYESKGLYLPVRVDIKTGIVKEESYCFFDYEQAESIHKKRRIEFLKNRTDDIKEYQQELEELENFKKKENEMSLEDITADNEDRFSRAVKTYKDLAYVNCKEHLLEENLSKPLINRVSREFAIGTDLVRALLKKELLKMSIIQNLKKK